MWWADRSIPCKWEQFTFFIAICRRIYFDLFRALKTKNIQSRLWRVAAWPAPANFDFVPIDRQSSGHIRSTQFEFTRPRRCRLCRQNAHYINQWCLSLMQQHTTLPTDWTSESEMKTLLYISWIKSIYCLELLGCTRFCCTQRLIASSAVGFDGWTAATWLFGFDGRFVCGHRINYWAWPPWIRYRKAQLPFRTRSTRIQIVVGRGAATIIGTQQTQFEALYYICT